MTDSTTGWPHAFTVGTACVFCGTKTRPVVRRGEKERGVCEACSVEAYWSWREEPRGKVAATVSERPARLEVLLLRLASVKVAPGELPPNPVSPYSYELAVVTSDGDVGLPSADLGPEESDFAAVERIFRPLGLVTWGPCVELLCDAHSLRGEIVRVVLVTDWARTDSRTDEARGLGWRDWPPWDAVPGTGGLYLPLREVLALRALLSQSQEPRPPALSVEVRRVCADYLDTQHRLRIGEKGVDESMVEYQRKAMDDRERSLAAKVARWEETEAEAARDGKESKSIGEAPADKSDGVLPDPDEVSAPAGTEATTIEESFDEEDT